MSKKSVFCIATSRDQADRIVGQLKDANFSTTTSRCCFPDKDSTRDFAHEKNTKAPEGAVAGASTGGVIGGALGLDCRDWRVSHPRGWSVHSRPVQSWPL